MTRSKLPENESAPQKCNRFSWHTHELARPRRSALPDPIKGEALVCFCVLKKSANEEVDPSTTLRTSLATELKKKVATELGKALAPRDILFVADIPKTRNAKVMRRLVRTAYIGEKLGDTSALENPGALDEIARLKTN